MVRVRPWLSVVRGHLSRRAVVVLALIAAATLSPHGASATISANLVRFPTGYPSVIASASREYSATYAASKAIDGSYTAHWGYEKWAPGDWWRGTWQSPITVDRVKVYPRTLACDNFGYGRVRFSDGSNVAFDVRGYSSSSPLTLDFEAKVDVVWIELVTDAGAGNCSPGLAEVEAYNTAVSTTANLLRPSLGAAYSASHTHSAPYAPAKAADGSPGTAWHASGYSVGLWWRVDWSAAQAVDRVKLAPPPAACDNFGYGTIHFSDSSTVAFDLRGQTSPVTVDFTRRTGITWMKVVSDGGGGTCNAGLVEVEAYDTAPLPTASIPDLDVASDSALLHEVSQTVIIRPDADGLISNTTFSSGTTGWNLINEALVDANTYVKPNANGYAYFSFASAGLPSDATITGVVIRANVANPAVASTATMAVRQGSTGDIDVVASFVQNVGADQTISLPLTTWAGQPWTVADLDDLQVGVIGPSTYANLRLRQVWLEITYLTRTPAGYDADSITYLSTPSFSGTVESGVTSVDLYIDDQLVGTDDSVGSGSWSISADALDEGTYTVWAEGHSSVGTTESPAAAVTIDTQVDAELTPSSDSGALNPVLRTVTLRPTSDASVSGDVVFSSGTTAWNLVDEYMLRTSDNVNVRNGSAVVGLSDAALNSELVIDEIRIEARVRNTAPAQNGALIVRNPATGTAYSVATVGQNPTPFSVALTSRPWDSLPWTPADIDGLQIGASCTCPTYPKLMLDQLWVNVDYLNPEPGAYGTDGITNVTTPTLIGTNRLDAARVDILDGASVVGSDTDIDSGTWEVEVDALAAGEHSLEVEVYDASDNLVGWAPAIELTVDLTGPTAPSAPDLDTSSDNGVHNNDNITTVTTPVFSGTISGEGLQVELYANETRVGQDTDLTGGTWSITSATLQPGEYEITARAIDAVGNESASAPLEVAIVGSLVHLKSYATPSGDLGAVTYVSVVVQDEVGQPVDDFAGTITLSSNDSGVSWPDGNTFVMDPDDGTTGHTFRVVFGSTGSRTVTASGAGAVSGTTAAVTVDDTNLELEVVATGHPNVPLAVRVVPRRADGTVARQYRGLITLSSSAGSTTFGPEVNGSGQYQFECGCGDGKTFGAMIPATGNHTISVSDGYGNSDQVSVQIVAAPTTGTDPVTTATAVRWDFGSRSEFYLNASAPFTLLAVEDISQASTVLQRTIVYQSLASGYQQFGVDASRGGHIVAGDLIDVASERIWYTNADGRVFSKNVSIEQRFSDVPNSSSYVMLDPGHPVDSWEIVERTREVTTLEITAHEPFVITDVAYTYQGTDWQPALGQYYVPAGTSEIDISNDPAACYIGSYQLNDHIKLEIIGFGNGRQGRLTELYIPSSQPPYSGSCSSDPPPGPPVSWFSDLLGRLQRGAEAIWTRIGDPIDAADGYLHGPVTDVSLGGLSPALVFSRTYDGEDAEAANIEPSDTLLGQGWRSSLDWKIETFLEDPEGVLVRGADGGALVFLRNADESYSGLGGVPFTFAGLPGGGYALTRVDRSGVRFDTNGRLVAFFDRTGREMTVQYDTNGDVISFTDAAGRTADVSTNAAGQITDIELPDGRDVAFEYDASGRLIRATDLAGKEMQYTLDVRGRITRIDDHTDMAVLRNLYDGNGRVIRQTDGEGHQTHLTFDEGRGTTQAFDPLGNPTTFCTDRTANLYTSFDAADGKRTVDYDSLGHPNVVTDELGETTRLSSDELGRLTEVVDTLDRQTTFDYNSAGDLIEVVDAEGRVLDIDYGANELPSSISITDGTSSQQVVAYTYTASDEVEEVTEASGAETELAYDVDGYIDSIVDPEGAITTFTTDARGFVTSAVGPLGNVLGGTPSEHDWTFTYDAMGRQTGSEDPTGADEARTYDHMGRLTTLTDPSGVVTTFDHDADGRLLSASVQGATGPAAVTEYEYDAAGRLAAVIDPEERRTEFGYDRLGRLIETIDADDKSWISAFDAKGRVISTTDPTGREVTFEYDAADHLVSRTDAGGHETTYEYDDAGRLTAITEPLDQVTAYEYDWLGRLTQVTDPLSNVTAYEYDSANDLISTTNARNKTTSFEYDAAHRLTNVIDALLGETTYEYDVAGRLVTRENARGYAETFEYDAAGRPMAVVDPLTNSWSTVYDAFGRIDHTIDAEGQQTDFDYDPLGRLVTVSPDTGSNITYTYDLTGRRLSMADGNGTTTYDYDPIGRLTELTRDDRTFAYAYDGAGRLNSVDYPGSLGSVELDYDPEGRLDEITDWDSRVTAFAYDGLDRVTAISRPGDLLSSYAYDALGRITAIDHEYDGSPVMELGYEYDAVGNVVERTDDQGAASFTYDDLDRLTSADYAGSDDYAYAYDAAGNLTSITKPSGTTTHTYDAADRISDTGFVYDDNGALTSDGLRSFTYDALGRLVGISSPSLSATYTLDGDGNRQSETVNSATTAFDLDLRGLPTVLVAGEKSFLPGMPSLGYETSTGWLGTLADAQGSVLQTIDSAGVTGTLMRYDPYGNVRPGSTASTGVGYTGEWADPAGLVNLRFRAYDPALGQFLSRDSFAGLPASPLSGNRHAYALGNPLRYADPTGHFVSSNSPVAVGIHDWLASQCTAWNLNACTADSFVQMTTSERIAWLDDFQSEYRTDGWFNNIRGILRVTLERGVDGAWFSRVDASILEAIALGKSTQLERYSGDSQNPGVTLWAQFFSKLGQPTSNDDYLRSLWGPAEQSATTYGYLQAEPLSRTLQDEIVLIGFGNVYRLAVSDPAATRSLALSTAHSAAKAACTALRLGWGCELAAIAGSVLAVTVADQLSDPRNEWAAYQFTHWLYDANSFAANVPRP